MSIELYLFCAFCTALGFLLLWLFEETDTPPITHDHITPPYCETDENGDLIECPVCEDGLCNDYEHWTQGG